jgi:hypothetical protein
MERVFDGSRDREQRAAGSIALDTVDKMDFAACYRMTS